MDDVAADFLAKVEADLAGAAFYRVGGTHQRPADGDGRLALHDHGHHGATLDVGDEAFVERALLVHLVMLGDDLGVGHLQAHGLDLEALAFEAGDDVSDQAARHGVRLDHDEGLFDGHRAARPRRPI